MLLGRLVLNFSQINEWTSESAKLRIMNAIPFLNQSTSGKTASGAKGGEAETQPSGICSDERAEPQTALAKTFHVLVDIVVPCVCSVFLWAGMVALARKKIRCGIKLLLVGSVLALPLFWYKTIYQRDKDDGQGSG